MDEASRIIESFESLWFFTGVFSPINRTLCSAGDKITAGIHVEESPVEEPQENISPALQNKLNHEFPSAETSVITFVCPKCGDFAAEIVKPAKIVEPIEMEWLEYSQRPIEKQERRRTRRRRKRSKNRRRKTLGELDLGFDLKEVSESWMFEETCRYPMTFEDQHPNILPSFNDNLAMKEHLKSWAHAVACTVR